MKITKETKIMSLGIGTGIVLPYILRKVDNQIPFPMQGVNWSWLVPLTTGPISLLLLWMGKIKKANTKTFLKAYGISTTLMGLLNLINYYQVSSASRARLSSCPTCLTSSLPTKAQSAIRYPYLYAPDSDIWSVKPSGYGSQGYPYAPTTFSGKTILA
jgi:hypothetical protein